MRIDTGTHAIATALQHEQLGSWHVSRCWRARLDKYFSLRKT